MLSSNITSSFFFEYVCPSLGVVFATAMFTGKNAHYNFSSMHKL